MCSFSELQLKPEHKPIQHLKNWKSRIVVMFTDQDPDKEDPQLFWRRDAILTIDMEKKVSVSRYLEQTLNCSAFSAVSVIEPLFYVVLFY